MSTQWYNGVIMQCTHDQKSIAQLGLDDNLSEHGGSYCQGRYPPAVVGCVKMVHARSARYFFEVLYKPPVQYSPEKRMRGCHLIQVHLFDSHIERCEANHLQVAG